MYDALIVSNTVLMTMLNGLCVGPSANCLDCMCKVRALAAAAPVLS